MEGMWQVRNQRLIEHFQRLMPRFDTTPDLKTAIGQHLNNAVGAVTAAAPSSLRPVGTSAFPQGEVVTIHLINDGNTQSVQVNKLEKDQAVQFFQALGRDKRSSA
jgi:hypothetical protein